MSEQATTDEPTTTERTAVERPAADSTAAESVADSVGPLPDDEESFGGRWVAEAFVAALDSLAEGYRKHGRRRGFRRQLAADLERYGGRPTQLYRAEELSRRVGGARILLKREDRLETGSRHLTVALGQALLARTMGRQRLVASSATGGGAVAVAAAAAHYGLEATVYGGVEDLRVRQRAFSRAETLGAEVVAVDLAAGGIQAATQVAYRDWRARRTDTSLVLTAPVGPDPFPRLVGDLESMVGLELSAQMRNRQMRKRVGRRAPDVVVAPLLGGGTVGLFLPWMENPRVRLIATAPEIAAEAASDWRRPVVIYGTRTLVLPPPPGEAIPDRPRRSRALAPWLAEGLDDGRLEVVFVDDGRARAACRRLAETEGLLVSVQSGEVLAEACERASRLGEGDVVVAAMVGRGNDDIGELSAPLPAAPERPGPARDWSVAVDPGELP